MFKLGFLPTEGTIADRPQSAIQTKTTIDVTSGIRPCVDCVHCFDGQMRFGFQQWRDASYCTRYGSMDGQRSSLCSTIRASSGRCGIGGSGFEAREAATC